MNVTVFSATLVDHSNHETFVKKIGINAFFDLRKALEITVQTHAIKTSLHNSVVSLQQAMEIDVVAGAKWVIYAGIKLLYLENAGFGNHWTRRLSQKTDLWDSEPRFSEVRRGFWARRLYESRRKGNGYKGCWLDSRCGDGVLQ